MKKSFKVLIYLFALGAVILLGLHLFLQFGLTKTLREVVLPQLKADYGIDAKVGRLSINLPNGMLYLEDIEVRNPEGFLLENVASIGRVAVQVDLFSLLGKEPIIINRIEVESALLNVIRNKEGEFNLDSLQAALPPPPEPVLETGTQPPPEKVPEVGNEPTLPQPRPEVAQAEPLREIIIQSLSCRAKVRYVDFRLDQLDIVLDLGLSGSNLSNLRDPAAKWGELSLMGSLGNRRTSFVTDLNAQVAPLVNPETPSFDLGGKVMEIDPRLLDEAYDKLGIRSAPFGLEPFLHCRAGEFQDSSVVLELRDIVLEDKLADRLGGMASIGSLRFPVPIEGSLQAPSVNMQSALTTAVGGNAHTLVSSFLSGMLEQEAGVTNVVSDDLTDTAVAVLAAKVDEIGESETVQKVLKDLANGAAFDTNSPAPINADLLVDVLSEQVDEVGESETVQKALKDLANGAASDTNSPAPVNTDLLIDVLGEQVDEIGENEALKEDLKSLGKWIFGK